MKSNMNFFRKVLLAVAVLSAAPAMAGSNPVKLVSGDLKAALQIVDSANIVMDFTQATIGSIKKGNFVGETMTFDEYMTVKDGANAKNWDKDFAAWTNIVAVQFNKKNKKGGLKIEFMNPSAKHNYTLKVIVDKVDFGDLGKSIAGSLVNPMIAKNAGGATMFGRIQIVENETGNILCEAAFDNVAASGNATRGARLCPILLTITSDLFKLLK